LDILSTWSGTELTQFFIGQKNSVETYEKTIGFNNPNLAAMIGMVAILGLNSVSAQNVSTINMTGGGANMTILGNTTSSGNMITSSASSGSMYNK
jgi:hypothetical protein